MRQRSTTTSLPGFPCQSLSSSPFLFFFKKNLFFLLSSQQRIFHVASQPSDGKLQFSLQGRGQTKGLTLRYTVVLIGSLRLMSGTAPNDELEIQHQGSLEMATRQLLACQKNNYTGIANSKAPFATFIASGGLSGKISRSRAKIRNESQLKEDLHLP